jgi:DNA polymerase-3 subunit epsilon
MFPRRLPTPDPRTPWREAEFCVLDVETTGLDLVRDDIVSYGTALVVQARIPCGRVGYRQVRPARPVSAAALAVHGLRSADLADGPTMADQIDDLIGRLSGRVPVAHAAWVERAFVNRALRPRGRRLGRRLVDTAALLRAGRLASADTGEEPNLENAAHQLGLPVHTPTTPWVTLSRPPRSCSSWPPAWKAVGPTDGRDPSRSATWSPCRAITVADHRRAGVRTG